MFKCFGAVLLLLLLTATPAAADTDTYFNSPSWGSGVDSAASLGASLTGAVIEAPDADGFSLSAALGLAGAAGTFTTTRVVNGKKKLSGAAKAAFEARMAKGKRKSRGSRRRRNPSLRVAGVSMEDAGYATAGVTLGALLSVTVVNFLDRHVGAQITNDKLRGLGYIAGAVLTVIGGKWAQRRMPKVPIFEPASYALAGYIGAQGLGALGIGSVPSLGLSVPYQEPPALPPPQDPPADGTVYAGNAIEFQGTIEPNMLGTAMGYTTMDLI